MLLYFLLLTLMYPSYNSSNKYLYQTDNNKNIASLLLFKFHFCNYICMYRFQSYSSFSFQFYNVIQHNFSVPIILQVWLWGEFDNPNLVTTVCHTVFRDLIEGLFLGWCFREQFQYFAHVYPNIWTFSCPFYAGEYVKLFTNGTTNLYICW